METINIGVASWIIQDGNYHDFSLGETHQFALEFYAPEPLKRSREQMPRMVAVVGNEYDASARVAFVDKEVWVIDAGLLMYCQEAPPRVAIVGNSIAGKVLVGIDPFFYKEELHSIPGMPSLNYRFTIEAISIETTPWVKTFAITRRSGPPTFRPIERTNAWKDDDQNADYVLHCRLIAPGTAI